MKKSLTRISVVALAAIIGLGSCDAILNAVYPEFDPENGDRAFGNNRVHVSISVPYDFNLSGNPLMVSLVPMRLEAGNWILKPEQAWIQSFWNMYSFDYYFEGLPEGAYRVFAWHEQNSNGKPDTSEPSVIATTWNQYGQMTEIFDFRGGGDSDTQEGYAWLDAGSRMPYEWLSQLNPNAHADAYSFWLSGPSVVQPSSSPYFAVNLSGNQPASVSRLDWVVYDGSMSPRISDVIYNPTQMGFYFSAANLQVNQYYIVKVVLSYSDGNTRSADLGFSVSSDDPSFSISGPATLTNNDYEYSYYLVPNDQKTISAAQWRIIDAYQNLIGYDGSYGWRSTSELNSISIVPSQIDGYAWTSLSAIYLEVFVSYDDGSSYQSSIMVRLGAEGESLYDLDVSFYLGNGLANGYAVVALYETGSDRWIQSNYGYLDSSGNAYFSFYGITDTSSTSQYVQYYYYDSSWNYQGGTTVSLPENPEPTNSIYISGSDQWSASWM